MLFLVWMALTCAIILSSDIISHVLRLRGWHRFFSTFFIFYFQVIATEFVLGILGILNGSSILILNTCISTLIFLSVYYYKGSALYRKYAIESVSRIKFFVDEIKSDYFFLILLLLSISIISWVIFLGIIFPVTDVDGNSYHMTFIAQSIQNQNIFDAPTSISWLAGYPKGGELIQLWNVLIPNSEALADLAQVPFLFLGVVSLYALSLRIGAQKKDARFVALLFIFLPIVINQAKSTYVDVMLSALFIAALAMVTKIKPSRVDLVIIGIIFSLLISIKYTGLLFVIASIPFLIYSTFDRKVGAALNLHRLLTSLLIVAVPMLFGVYWYIKNLIVFGTPLSPFGLKIAGIDIFEGKTFQDFISTAFSNSSVLPSGSIEKIWFVWTEQSDWFGCLYNYDSTFSGLGPIWFVLLIPSAMVGVVTGLKKRNYILLSLMAMMAIVFFLYPANYYPRYVIFIVAVGIISLGFVLSNSGTRFGGFVRVIALLLSFITIGTSFTLCNFTPSVIKNQVHSIRAGDMRSGKIYEDTIGKSFLFLQNEIKPGETVVYDSSPYYIYPLWRPDHSNKVLYISSGSKEEWSKKLNQVGAKYVFTSVASKENKWILEDQAFDNIYRDKNYEVYKIH